MSRKITEEEHRCQAEEESEELETVCAIGTNTCQDINIRGKEYNLCCCNDKPW